MGISREPDPLSSPGATLAGRGRETAQLSLIGPRTSPPFSVSPTSSLAMRTAALLCLALLALLLSGCGEPAAPPMTPPGGGGELVLQAPLGAVERYDVFFWDYALPSGGHFEVAVYDFSSGEALGPLRRSGSLDLPQWTPREGVVQRWPVEILWRAFAYDREGALLASAEASASRR